MSTPPLNSPRSSQSEGRQKYCVQSNYLCAYRTLFAPASWEKQLFKVSQKQENKLSEKEGKECLEFSKQRKRGRIQKSSIIPNKQQPD